MRQLYIIKTYTLQIIVALVPIIGRIECSILPYVTYHPQRLFPSGTWRPRALCTTHSYVASFYSTWHDAAADRQTKAYMIHCNNLTDRQFVELISESSVCLPPMPVIADGRLSSSHTHSDVEDRQANSEFCTYRMRRTDEFV